MMFGHRKLKEQIAHLQAENSHLFRAVRHKNGELAKAERLLQKLPKDTPGLAEWFSQNGSAVVERKAPEGAE